MNLHEQCTSFMERPVDCNDKDPLRGRFRRGETIGLVIVALASLEITFDVDFFSPRDNRNEIGS